MEVFMEIASNFGFPVAVCGVLMWYINKTQEQHRDELKEINKEHKEETVKMIEAINENTNVIQRLADRLCEGE